MKINRNINNVDELRAEISRLKVLQIEQEAYLTDQLDLLQEKVDTPMRVFSKLASWIPLGGKEHSGNQNHDGEHEGDWLTSSMRVGLPFLFNKVLFRKAGFIKKALLLLASQKAAGAINQDLVVNIIDKVSAFIKPSKKKKEKKKEEDYGIPPDSETY